MQTKINVTKTGLGASYTIGLGNKLGVRAILQLKYILSDLIWRAYCLSPHSDPLKGRDINWLHLAIKA